MVRLRMTFMMVAVVTATAGCSIGNKAYADCVTEKGALADTMASPERALENMCGHHCPTSYNGRPKC
jgi:hypothetical protein